MLMRGSGEDKNHNPILHFTSVLTKIIIVFFVMSFIDNRHLGSILLASSDFLVFYVLTFVIITFRSKEEL